MVFFNLFFCCPSLHAENAVICGYAVHKVVSPFRMDFFEPLKPADKPANPVRIHIDARHLPVGIILDRYFLFYSQSCFSSLLLLFLAHPSFLSLSRYRLLYSSLISFWRPKARYCCRKAPLSSP